MIKKILFFLLIFVIVIVLFFTYTSSKKETMVGEEINQPGQNKGNLTTSEYQDLYLDKKREAENTEDKHEKAVNLLDAASHLKKTTTDVDLIAAEFNEIYSDTSLENEERGLALFKISQQANGNNRFDLFDEFLQPEQKLLSDREKNYIINKRIFELSPFSLVYADILSYEVGEGLEYSPEDIYTEIHDRVNKDIESFKIKYWLTSLIPDTVMHEALLYSQIDETAFPNGLSTKIVLDTFDRALELNGTHSTNNPTKDFIYLEKINYLSKIDQTSKATQEVNNLLSQEPSGMIKTFVQNGGLTNGRFEHIANDLELLKSIQDGLTG